LKSKNSSEFLGHKNPLDFYKPQTLFDGLKILFSKNFVFQKVLEIKFPKVFILLLIHSLYFGGVISEKEGNS